MIFLPASQEARARGSPVLRLTFALSWFVANLEFVAPQDITTTVFVTAHNTLTVTGQCRSLPLCDRIIWGPSNDNGGGTSPGTDTESPGSTFSSEDGGSSQSPGGSGTSALPPTPIPTEASTASDGSVSVSSGVTTLSGTTTTTGSATGSLTES
ncbi:hypothetical protein TWF481_002173 [Arthrobotrys musiformis]|uniref:Uncharacterized protein n=1 Tax=Arthrobotrys musiformis TaxID=47236 RepID=A0AAV9VSK3_9PEZI